MTGGGGGEKEEDKGAPSQHHTCFTDTQGKNKLSKKHIIYLSDERVVWRRLHKHDQSMWQKSLGLPRKRKRARSTGFTLAM